jgi:uncharacterized iron-regulated membrane protein
MVAVGKSWRRFNFDLHHAVGFYSSLFLLILSLTGVMVAFDEYTVPMFYSMTNSEPAELDTDSTVVDGTRAILADQAVAAGLTTLPGTS